MATWTVYAMDRDLTQELADVVVTLHYQCTDEDGDAAGRVYGTVGLAAPDSSSFTAYADITEADAIAWVKAALGDDAVAAAEAAVAAQIAEQKNPTVATGVPSSWLL